MKQGISGLGLLFPLEGLRGLFGRKNETSWLVWFVFSDTGVCPAFFRSVEKLVLLGYGCIPVYFRVNDSTDLCIVCGGYVVEVRLNFHRYGDLP